MQNCHFNLPDSYAHQLNLKAEEANLSLSKYIAEMVKKDVESQWPEYYFELFGRWQGDELKRE